MCYCIYTQNPFTLGVNIVVACVAGRLVTRDLDREHLHLRVSHYIDVVR